MRSLESHNARIVAALALAALLALPVAALAESEAAQPAGMAVTPGGISWEPPVTFDKLVLTVQGDGYAATREFTGAARFSPVDDEGNSLADGTYTWELTVARPALDANNYHYRSDEPSADGRSMKQGTAPEGMILSGAFTISGGAIADPGQAEPASTGSRPSTRAAARADVDDSDEANP